MRVRMLTSLVGPTVAVTTGDVYDCDAATAARLIAAGYAEPDAPAASQQPETAMVEPRVERAVKHHKGRGR